MNFKNAKLTCSLAEETDTTVAAESRAMKSDERLVDIEAHLREQTASASKAADALARKAAVVESVAGDLMEAGGEGVADDDGRLSVHEVQVGDACGNASTFKQKTEFLGEELDKAPQTDKERSRYVGSCVSR